MADVLHLFERLDSQCREDDARRREKDMQREERRQREFQQLITATLERQTAGHELERRDLEEHRRKDAAEDRVAREQEAVHRRRERNLDKKRQSTPQLPRMREDAHIC